MIDGLFVIVGIICFQLHMWSFDAFLHHKSQKTEYLLVFWSDLDSSLIGQFTSVSDLICCCFDDQLFVSDQIRISFSLYSLNIKQTAAVWSWSRFRTGFTAGVKPTTCCWGGGGSWLVQSCLTMTTGWKHVTNHLQPIINISVDVEVTGPLNLQLVLTEAGTPLSLCDVVMSASTRGWWETWAEC